MRARAAAPEPPLPACVLGGLIWPRAHQARLRPSLDLIRKSGCSFFEDLPDLEWHATHELIHSCDTHQQMRGWSQRVTEFYQDLRRVEISPRASLNVAVSATSATSSEGDESVAEEVDVVLVSQEGQSFHITPSMAAMSRLLVVTLEDEDEMSTDGDEDAEEPAAARVTIPLPSVRTRELTRVVAFMREHLTRPPPAIRTPLRSARLRDLVSAWDADFVENLGQEDLFALILAANYLDMPALLDLTTARAASSSSTT